jgi:hypothetical protein
MRHNLRRPFAVVVVIGVGMIVALSAMARPARVHFVSTCPAKERWDVKTLSDPDVTKVRINTIVDTTVAKLRLTKPGVTIGTHTPRLSSERTVYRVTAELVEAKVEPDGDVHLVITIPGQPTSKRQMIAEFPKAECPPESGSPDVEKIDKARSDFEQICGMQHAGFKHLHGLATITGVGFFDVKHGGVGQTGHAPDNRELHPVIGFSATAC